MCRERPRVLLAEDHLLIGEGIRELLIPRYDVIGIVADGESLVERAMAGKPDVVVTDVSMPGLDGIEATRRLSRCLPEMRVIVLTVYDDERHVRAAFEAGAAGYLVKSSDLRELFEAIEVVLAGRRYLTPRVAGQVLDSFLPSQPKDGAALLTRREIEIASLVSEGLENAEIAGRLCIAEVTVRTHFRHILRKLALKNRVEVARHALGQGWSSLEQVPG